MDHAPRPARTALGGQVRPVAGVNAEIGWAAVSDFRDDPTKISFYATHAEEFNQALPGFLRS